MMTKVTGNGKFSRSSSSYTAAVSDGRRLAQFPMFDGVDDSLLARFADRLSERSYEAGEVMLRQGDPASTFLIVVAGHGEVIRDDGRHRRTLAVVGPGSIVGELALLRGSRRAATLQALDAVDSVEGDQATFELLLDLPGVHERLSLDTARRMAEIARPVHVTFGEGHGAQLRPLLRTDRSGYRDSVRQLLPESRRRRFFTVGPPSERVIDYLVNIDYIDHFAWVASTDTGGGAATARYVRSEHLGDTAEVAFGVNDAYHGRGLGTMLLGALGAAAERAGISTFVAEVLDENIPMRRVFDKVAATWRRVDGAVLAATMSVEATRQLLRAEDWQALGDVAEGIVTAAGTSLATVEEDDPAIEARAPQHSVAKVADGEADHHDHEAGSNP